MGLHQSLVEPKVLLGPRSLKSRFTVSYLLLFLCSLDFFLFLF